MKVGLFIAAALLLAAAGASDGVQAQDEPLPEGPGRTILTSACSSCHELKEVTKFKGYYDAAEWRDIIVTMIKYGAQVKDKDVDVLVEYLAKNLGRKP